MKCTKVKNPCKICFQTVNKKNGLQCQGACRKWAHYKCLNYTPGKIHDVKAGVIKVTCPCPDCSTTEPKESLVNPPYTCTNTQCPANNLPVCTSTECPSKDNAIPIYPPPPFEYSPVKHENIKKCQIKLTSSSPKLKTIGQQYSRDMQSPLTKCSSSDIFVKPKKNPCPPFCPSQHIIKISNRKPCSAQQSKSCSNFSNLSGSAGVQCERIRSIASDSNVSKVSLDQKTLFNAIESLCKTVGQLTNQLKVLMSRMNNTLVE